MRTSSRLFLAVIAIALVRCGMGDDVSETKDASKRIETTSSEIAKGISKVIYLGRKGAINEQLPKIWANLWNSDTNPDRIHYATQLVKTNEFQQWTGSYADTTELKSQLETDALRIFFAFIKGKILRDFALGTLPPDRRWLSLAGVAVSLHEIDEQQVKACRENGIEARSFYSMIIDGLSYKAANNRHEKIPDFASEVLVAEPEAVFLLQLRHNYFPIMVLSEFSDLDKVMFHWTNAVNTPIDFSKWLFGLSYGFSAQFNNGNFEKMDKEGTRWLEFAMQTQRDLVSLGYPLEVNRFMAHLFNRSTFDFSGVPDTGPEIVSSKALIASDIQKIKATYSDNVHRGRLEKGLTKLVPAAWPK